MTELISDAIVQIVVLSFPFLIAGLLISLLIGFVQAITQIQDATISFVPKLIVLLLLVVFGLPWFMEMIADYSGHLFKNISITSG